jgi:hypothetical protein
LGVRVVVAARLSRPKAAGGGHKKRRGIASLLVLFVLKISD